MEEAHQVTSIDSLAWLPLNDPKRTEKNNSGRVYSHPDCSAPQTGQAFALGGYDSNLTIPENEKISPLRIDPAQAAGEYQIQLIEVRVVERTPALH